MDSRFGSCVCVPLSGGLETDVLKVTDAETGRRGSKRRVVLSTTAFVLTFATSLLQSCAASSKVLSFQHSRADSPCQFNPGCLCAGNPPQLSVVRCMDVSLLRTPAALNVSKVVMLQLDNNGLRELEPRFATRTGMSRLDVSRNLLTGLGDEVLQGLERSLTVLELRFNRLTEVPLKALLHLHKLNTLDLTGNEITDLPTENWRGLEETLTKLILARNSIWSLPGPGTFNSLRVLETLDLSGNSLVSIDAGVLFSPSGPPPRLQHLYMADNQLRWFPYDALRNLRYLQTLDLSSNLITTLMDSPVNSEQPMRLKLDALHLQHNHIHTLRAMSFRHFEFINKTYLDGNPLEEIEENAFRPTRIQELWLRDCNIWMVHPLAFGSDQDHSISLIDLSANNITILPPLLLRNLQNLRSFSIRYNRLSLLDFDQLLGDNDYLRRNFEKLDFGGRLNPVISPKDLRGLQKLTSLSVSRLPQSQLSPYDLEGVGEELQELRLSDGRLSTLQNHAFRYARGLKILDLSDNSIKSIESDAFHEVGKSILTLKMSRALSGALRTLPSDAFRALETVTFIDLSHNRLRTVPENSFVNCHQLVKIHLRDNEITAILRGTFQGHIHQNLEEIDASYNEIATISSKTFEGLDKLTRLSLDENLITHIEKGAFVDLSALKYLGLRGNKITRIEDEAFQTIHQLQELDLAFNRITFFDFAMFDQVVGSTGSLRMNMSYNQLHHLEPNVSLIKNHANVKSLDMSHNNISSIGRYFFSPVEMTLSELYFGFNSLQNATSEVFGHLPGLTHLDLSANQLQDIHFDTFRTTEKLQSVSMARNRLSDLPAELYRNLRSLRIVDLSHNSLRTLPDALLTEEGPEWLDFSHNMFSRLPFSCISPSAAGTLRYWDLSHNILTTLHSTDMFNRFRTLQFLDLSYNRLTRLDEATFSSLPRLVELDISHNPELQLDNRGYAFRGISDSLRTLRMANLTQEVMPELHLPSLLELSVARNRLSSVGADISSNLSSLRSLDLSYNQLTQVPLVTSALQNLRRLSLAGNPLHQLGNTSMLGGVERLRQLDLRWLPLTHFEPGALSKMVALESLYLSTYREVRDYRIPLRLMENTALRRLHVEVDDEGEDLDGEMRGYMPDKVSWLTLSGRRLRAVPNDLFVGFRTPRMRFILRNTSVENLPFALWDGLKYTRNLTLDIRNNSLRTMHNPNMAQRPDQSGMFLNSLLMAGNRWSCDCDLGWVEVWARKQRQYFCPQPLQHSRPPAPLDSREFLYFEHNADCTEQRDDDLREAHCSNRYDRPVLEIFKEEVECGWGLAGRPGSMAPLVIGAAVIAALIGAMMIGV